MWSILLHQGNSSTAARILLVARLLKVLPTRRWAMLIADREFVGQEWFNFLRWKRIRQCLRIRENTRIEDDLARELFTTLQPGEVRTLFERTWVYGGWMHMVVTLSPRGQGGRRLKISYSGRSGELPASLRDQVRVLVVEEPRAHAHDGIFRLFEVLCVALTWMARMRAQTLQESPPRHDTGEGRW